MSLPRDLVVDIPGHGRDRLNAAFALGEDKLTLRTVAPRCSTSRSTTTSA